MGESGGGHLTASLCVLLAQVMIVMVMLVKVVIVVVMLVKMVMTVVLVIFVLCKTVRMIQSKHLWLSLLVFNST